jgi:hypothetical protein
MKRINNLLVALSAVFILTACNKDLEQLAPISVAPYPTGTSLAATIAANPADSLFNRLLIRTGFAATLNDLTKTFTIFAVDNAGMKVFVNGATSGVIPLTAGDSVFSRFIAGTNTTVFPPLTTPLNLPIASAVGIAQYLTLGQKLPAASIGTNFPNYPYTSQIILDPTQPFVRMPIFPVRGTSFSYVNNIPLTGVDQAAANGIIHHAFTIAAPPSATLKTMIAGEATLKYFRAAIARGDVGSTGLSRLDSLLNYGVTNMTVLTPNDAAMQPVLKGILTQGYIQAGLSPFSADSLAALKSAVDSLSSPSAGFNILPVANVRGIIAYHFLATNSTGSYTPNIRVFSVNVPGTPTFVKTLVNGSVAVHPGISAQAFYTGPVADSVKFTGLGTFPPGGAPYTGTPATSRRATGMTDKHAVNGVYHIIDRVLFPQ